MQLSTISVFYKQRNNFFFPVTSYALPTVLLRVPLSIVTGIIFTALTYFVVGFAPDAGRCAPLPNFLKAVVQQTFFSQTSVLRFIISSMDCCFSPGMCLGCSERHTIVHHTQQVNFAVSV